MGLKPFRLAISGHLDGSVQVWDLTKALEQAGFDNNKKLATSELGGFVNRYFEKSQIFKPE